MNREPQHFRIAERTSSASPTLRYVSWRPAKDAPSRSSAVAEERTAEKWTSCSREYWANAARIGSRSSGGNSVDSKASRIRRETASTLSGRSRSSVAMAPGISSLRTVESTNAW